MKQIFISLALSAILVCSCSSDSDEPVKEEPVSPNIEVTYRLELWSKDMSDWKIISQMLLLKKTGSFVYIKDVINDSKGAHEVTEEGLYTKRGDNIHFSPNGSDDIIREARISKDTIWVTVQEKAGIRYIMGHNNDIYNK